jgi:hypothetical protein
MSPQFGYCEYCSNKQRDMEIFMVCLDSLQYIPKSDVTESYGSSFCIFLRNFYLFDFHNVYTNLPSHQQCIKVSFALHPHWDLLHFVFLMIAILTGD